MSVAVGTRIDPASAERVAHTHIDPAARSSPPIEDYAVIGDSRSAALVSRAGSIDWLCWPRFDSPTVFCGLVDPQRGGSFSVRPCGVSRVTRRYVGDSAVLRTSFHTDHGDFELTDLMPIAGPSEAMSPLPRRPKEGSLPLGGTARSAKGAPLSLLMPEHEIVRVLLCTRGEGDVEVDFHPRTGFAQWNDKLRDRGKLGIRVETRQGLLTLRSDLPLVLSPTNSGATAQRRLRAGEAIHLSLTWSADAPAILPPLGEWTRTVIDRTLRLWQEWSSRTRFEGKYREQVMRSAIMGRIPPSERRLSNLLGYQGATPVQTGNGPDDQVQLDSYGEVIDAVWRVTRAGNRLDGVACSTIEAFGRYVCKHWTEPDAGIWEPRTDPQRHTHSLVLCWSALDRLIDLQDTGDLRSRHRKLFAETREQIRQEVETRGFKEALHSYTSTLDGAMLDATALLFGWYGFGEPGCERMRSTFAAVCADLSPQPGLLFRNTSAGDDGAFGVCSFWLAEHLARGGGTLQEARAAFEATLAFANDVGIFAEQIEPGTGAALGNFPQTFTHVGLINAALSIAEREKADKQCDEVS